MNSWCGKRVFLGNYLTLPSLWHLFFIFCTRTVTCWYKIIKVCLYQHVTANDQHRGTRFPQQFNVSLLHFKMFGILFKNLEKAERLLFKNMLTYGFSPQNCCRGNKTGEWILKAKCGILLPEEVWCRVREFCCLQGILLPEYRRGSHKSYPLFVNARTKSKMFKTDTHLQYSVWF